MKNSEERECEKIVIGMRKKQKKELKEKWREKENRNLRRKKWKGKHLEYSVRY